MFISSWSRNGIGTVNQYRAMEIGDDDEVSTLIKIIITTITAAT